MKASRSSRKRPTPKTARPRWSSLFVEPLEDRTLLSLSVGPLTNVTRLPGNQEEATVVINPINPQQVFVASNNDGSSLTASFSTDGGTTFTSRFLANGTDGLPRACCDPQAAWDQFGNLYLTYIEDRVPDATFTNTIVLLSTNGGQSFTALPAITTTGVLPIEQGSDQPSLAVGAGDLPGTGSVWVFTARRGPGGGLYAAGARVTGAGQVGTFSPLQLATGSNTAPLGQFGDIAIGPTGQVMVTWQRQNSAQGPTSIHVNVDANGLAPGGFGAPVTVTNTNVGFSEFVPAQSERGFAAETNIVWDTSGGPRNGRVYLVYTDETPQDSDDTDVFVRFSDNTGATWSPRVRVNDDGVMLGQPRSQFLPNIALDRTTGNIAVAWLDARNDDGTVGSGSRDGIPNNDVQTWGTVSLDGGLTFLPNVQLSRSSTSTVLSETPDDIDLGDYNTMDFHNNVFFYVWADNSTDLPGNPGPAGRLDIATARVTVGNLSGIKFNDVNNDGVRTMGEPVLPGWTIYLEQAGLGTPGVLDTNLATTTFDSTEVPQAIPDRMTLNTNVMVSAMPGVITDVNLRLNITHPFDYDLNAVLVSPTGQRIRLFTGVGGAGDNFTNTLFDDQASTAIALGTAPFSDMLGFRPQDALSILNGADPNGTWRLEITDTANTETGTLNSWSLTIRTGERTTVTNATGAWAFSNLQPDTYTVREVLQSGWAQTAPASGFYTVTLTSITDVLTNRDFGNRLISPGVISGVKFNDLNANGIRNLNVPGSPDEPGLAGWTIFIDDDNDGVLDMGERNTMTDAMGNYSFTGLTPGTYIVREVLQSGWVQRAPLVGFLTVTLAAGESAFDQNFSNFQRASIAGTKFSDANGNGTRDTGEVGLEGTTVFLDLNNDGLLNTNVAAVASPNVPLPIPDNGMVTSRLNAPTLFGTIFDINVVVNITHPFISNIEATLISPTGMRILLVSGQGADGDDFGDTVFNDEASAAIQGGLAPFTGLAFRPMQLLSAVDGQSPTGTWQLEVRDIVSGSVGTLNSWSVTFTLNEPRAVTDASGNYSFTSLPPGTFNIRELPPTGFAPTTPVRGALNVMLTSGQNVTNQNFGNLQAAAIAGIKFNDANGNRLRDLNEQTLANWRVFLDANNNGTWDGSVATVAAAMPEVPRALTDVSTVVSTANVSGLTGNIWDVNVTLTITHPFDQALSAFLVSPSGTRVRLFTNVDGNGVNFTGTIFDDQAAAAIAAGLVPFTGLHRPQDALAQLNGENPNGTWRLEVQDALIATATRSLASWSLTISSGERGALTSNAGAYAFTGLTPGTYTVREESQTGFTQTAPQSGSHSVTLINGMVATNIDFGNQLSAASGIISGMKFHDLNGNGVLDTGEPGLEGWTIYLDTDMDRVLDANETRVVTDASGNYSFTGLPAGMYTVREILQAGWVRSLPQSGNILVTLAEGQMVTGQNHGNYQPASVSGLKFNDLNGNGLRDLDEPDLPGWTVFLDSNGNGQLDDQPGETGVVTQTHNSNDTFPREIAATANFTSFLLVTGRTGVITDIDVTFDINHTRMADLILNLVSPSGTVVGLFTAIGGASGAGFSNTVLDDEAATALPSGTPPFTGMSFRPATPLSDLDQENPNGIWLLQVVDNVAMNMGNLNGWSITITTGERSGVTDIGGNYFLGGLTPGSYTVREIPQSGWTQTAPASGTYSVTLISNQDVEHRDFGNRTGTISGTKFNDLNNNGVRNPGEPGLQGWTVFIDQNNNGTFDGSQQTFNSTTTAAIADFTTINSELTVSGLVGNIFDVDVTLNVIHTFTGDLQAFLVSPTGTRVRLFMNVGGAGANFINTVLDDESDFRIQLNAAPFTGSFRPEEPLSAFDGQNPTGTWRLEISDVFAGDVGLLTGWSLRLSTGERSTVTDAQGNYSFTPLAAGTYTLREVAQASFTPTTPASGSHSVTLATGQRTTDIDFGNRTSSISGVKYHDLSGEGVRDLNEPGLPGWTIFLDNNNNGMLDTTQVTRTASVGLPLDIPDMTTVIATLDVSGLVGPITDLNIRFSITHTVNPDLDVFLISPTGTRIELFTDVVGDGPDIANFTNTVLDDQAALPLGSGGTAAPFTGTFRPEGLLTPAMRLGLFNGENPNGTWRLVITDDRASTPPSGGTLTAWALIITTSEPTSVTNPQSVYNFTGLTPGPYNIREVLQAGWTPTAPAGGVHTVTLGAGDTVSGRDFGNRTPTAGSISGTVFHDQNGNGTRDTGEPGLVGWTVILDLDNDRIVDATDYNATTDANGNYSFTGLPPATYSVRIVLMPGFAIGSPSARFHSVVLGGGQSVTGRDFANFQASLISGLVYEDKDGDNVQDDDEDPLPNWRVFLEQSGIGTPGTFDTNLATSTFTSTDVPQPINDFHTASSTLVVSGMPGVIHDVNFTLNVTHPQLNTLIGLLTSAAGDQIVLFIGPGFNGDNFTGTIFDDQSGVAINSGAPPFTGSFRSVIPLSDYIGENPNGTWQLQIIDPVGMNTGTINGWSLTIRTGERHIDSFFGDGTYAFAVPPSNYTIRTVLQPGWSSTTPGGGLAVTLVSNQEAEDRDLGNRTGSIAGRVFHDFNGNGVQDTGEPGTPGWTVFLDTNNNGVWDGSSTTVTATPIPQVGIPDFGVLVFPLEVSGLVGNIFDVNVGLRIAHTFDSDLQVYLVSPAGTRVRLFTNVGGAGDNFGTTTTLTVLNDEGIVPILAGAAPFSGTFVPEEPLSMFDGQNPNGIWRLELSDVDAGDVGALFTFALGFATGERIAVSDALGDYLFPNLAAGNYTVREVVEIGWQQTAPASGFHSVAVATGQMVMDRNFGNRLAVAAGQLQFSAATYSVNEGSGLATITVSRTSGSLGAVTVQFATSNGTALAGQDYTATSGTLTFTTGQTQATFTIPITDDSEVESAETVNLTLSAPGGGATLGTPITATLTIIDNDTVGGTLRVSNFTPTPTGFVITFNRAIDVNVLNLYDTQTGGLGLPDVTVTGPDGNVAGSLVLSGTNTTITFIATGGVLPAGSYMVRLRSAANGFRDTSGSLLDGNSDSTPGDDYTNTLIASPADVRVTVPDFMRGPGQTVNVPATSTRLPLRLNDGTNVTSVTLTLTFNPTLLNITAAEVGPSVPAGATVMLDTSTPGQVVVTFTSPTALPSGVIDFVRLTAQVPLNAPYTSKHVLNIVNPQVNAGAIAASDDDGLHVVGYFGDTSGNGTYGAVDAQRVLRVSVGLDTGFIAYQLADPVVIADITGDGRVSSIDATRILQEVVGMDRPEIPPQPDPLPVFPQGGPDPFLNFAKDHTANPGDTITIPLMLDLSDGLQFGDLTISYDTTRLKLASPDAVQRGSLTNDFGFFMVFVDPVAGTIRVGFARDGGPIAGRGSGSVVKITFQVRDDAPAGGAIINLRHGLGVMQTMLNDGRLDLIPDPSDTAGDILDGLIFVAGKGTSVKDSPTAEGVAVSKASAESPLEGINLRQLVAAVTPVANPASSCGCGMTALFTETASDHSRKLDLLLGTVTPAAVTSSSVQDKAPFAVANGDERPAIDAVFASLATEGEDVLEADELLGK